MNTNFQNDHKDTLDVPCETLQEPNTEPVEAISDRQNDAAETASEPAIEPIAVEETCEATQESSTESATEISGNPDDVVATTDEVAEETVVPEETCEATQVDMVEHETIDVSIENLQEITVKSELLGDLDFNIELIDQSMSNVSAGQVVDGTVVCVDDKEILVDIGCKSEAAISIHEFPADEIPAKGDIIRVYVVTKEGSEGKPVLSKKRADFVSNLTKVKEAFANNSVIMGKLTHRVKAGVIVEIFGVEAFLPGSQIAMKSLPNLDHFIGKELPMKIVKLDEGGKGIVVSRRLVLEAEFEAKKEKLKEVIKIDAELDGEVKNITGFGAFVDLGGIDGLLHITDMSWGKLKHPSDMLNIGDKIKVKCLGFDEENDRIALGLKQLVPHPWENIEAKFPEGSKITGKVVTVAKYGAFVELEPGVEGLVHVSEMSWTKRISNPKQIIKAGDTISAIVLVVSKEQQRISLGIRQMYPNPWVDIEQRYPEGMILTRKIKGFTSFGALIEVEPDIEGLIHISDISWTKRLFHPKEVFKAGDEVSAVVLKVDKLLSRIVLGVKQMTTDPWEDLPDDLPVNTEVVSIVSKRLPKGLLVEIPYKDTFIEGFVPISHLALPAIDKTEYAFDINEEIDMKIIEVDPENRRLILSVKAWFFSREKDDLKEYQKIHMDKIAQNKEKEAKKEAKKEAMNKKREERRERRREKERMQKLEGDAENEKTGQDDAVKHDEVEPRAIPVAEEVIETSLPPAEPEVAEETPPSAEPEVAEETPPPAEPEVAEETPASAEPEVVEETPASAESEVAEETPASAEPEVAEETPASAEPEVAEETPPSAEPEVAEETSPSAEPEVAEETPPPAEPETEPVKENPTNPE